MREVTKLIELYMPGVVEEDRFLLSIATSENYRVMLLKGFW